MDYPDAEGLAQAFSANHWLIHRLIDNLNHADSILQPPYEGNCLNWVLGHIIVSRNRVLGLLGAEKVWDDDVVKLYDTGSAPITADGQGLPFKELVEVLDTAQARIAASLETFPVEELNRVVETSRGVRPIGKHINGLSWHETYHLGQLELLAAMARSG